MEDVVKVILFALRDRMHLLFGSEFLSKEDNLYADHLKILQALPPHR